MKKLIPLLLTALASIASDPDATTHNFTISFESSNPATNLEYRVYVGTNLFGILTTNGLTTVLPGTFVFSFSPLTTNNVTYIKARLIEVPDGTNALYVTSFNPGTGEESEPSNKLLISSSVKSAPSTNLAPSHLILQ